MEITQTSDQPSWSGCDAGGWMSEPSPNPSHLYFPWLCVPGTSVQTLEVLRVHAGIVSTCYTEYRCFSSLVPCWVGKITADRTCCNHPSMITC